MKNWRPTNGRAIVRFKDEFAAAKASGLELPEMVEDRRSILGEVMDFRGTNGTQSIKIGDKVIVPLHVSGVKLGQGHEIIRISDISAIVDGDGDIDTIEQELPRCQYCGPAKPSVNSQGMIMQPTGPNGEYQCPRCSKDVNGKIPTDIKISDDEVEEYRRVMGVNR